MLEAFGYFLIFMAYLSLRFGLWKDLVPDAFSSSLARARPLLEMHHGFFQGLSEKGKKKFLHRCRWYLDHWRFTGAEGIEVTFEMKARIAAVAAQVTFGLRNHALSHFKHIRIFPGIFYSKLHEVHLKGGASTGGTMFLSWSDFHDGFSDGSDKLNLGIHEMAHALRIQLRHGAVPDNRFADFTDHFNELAVREMDRVRNGSQSYLRDYAGTNIEEFFAVSVEHFFEDPHEFSRQMPDLFNHLCYLFNLDPRNKDFDYRLPADFVEQVNSRPNATRVPEKLSKAWHYYDWNWSYNFILAGIFICLPAIFTLSTTVLFKGYQLMLIAAGCLLVVSGSHRFFRKMGIPEFRYMLFFGSLGLAPVVITLLLITNTVFTSGTTIQFHRILTYEKKRHSDLGANRWDYVLELENGAYRDYEKVRTVSGSNDMPGAGADPGYLVVATSTGIWGWTNIEYSRYSRNAEQKTD